MSEQTEGAEVEARKAADLYDEVHAAVVAEPVGSLARRLHSALGDLAHAVLMPPHSAAVVAARGAEGGGLCPHGQDGDWHGIAGDFLHCECCGGPVSVLGAYTPPPRCDDCRLTRGAEDGGGE